MAHQGYSPHTIADFVGRPLGVTGWIVIEIEGEDKPAMVADARAMLVAGQREERDHV